MSQFDNQARLFGAADLRKLRQDLLLSQADIAALLGIAAERTVRRLEREEIDPRTGRPHPITGPMRLALSYLQQGVLDAPMKVFVPEFITGDDATLKRPWNYIVRLWYPRFFGILVDEVPPGAEGLDRMEADTDEHLIVAMWIDPPGDRREEVLLRAVAQMANYTIIAEKGDP